MRAYSILRIKSIDGDQRIITGVASTPEPDRIGDVVEPKGMTFRNPVPLLLYHDTRQPVGTVTFDAPTADGLTFTAQLPTVDDAGTLRDRVDEAWQSIKTGLLAGVSIGFRAIEEFFIRETNAFRFSKTEVLELSLVTIPANASASIHTIKSLDLAASGHSPSGVADVPPVRARSARRMNQTTTTDATAVYEARRAAKAAQMQALMDNATNAGTMLDAPATEEYEGLEAEVTQIDKHLAQLRSLARITATADVATATRIGPAAGASATAASDARGGRASVQVTPCVEKGTAFIRMTCAKIVCRGNLLEASEYAKRWDDSTPEVSRVLKAAVAPGTTTDATWAGPLVVQQNIANEFLELLRPSTILGKITGLRRVPFNTKLPAQTGGGTYGWVGEGKPKPLTKLAFSSVALAYTKVAGIITITKELAKLSSPSAETIVRADMIAGIAQFLDQQFIDPAVAAVVNVHPASITNGTTPITSTGNPQKDLFALVSALTAANVDIRGLVVIMSEANALSMAMQLNANGSPLFPGMTSSGGTAFGIQVVTSNTAGTNVIAAAPSRILYADDGGVEIDVSEEASLQMSDAPDDPVTATTTYLSLWQNNLVGLRAERMVNWQRVDNVSVKYCNTATYTPASVGMYGEPLSESPVVEPPRTKGAK